MKLTDGEKDRRYTVRSMELPLQTERRLEALGMTEGTQVYLVNKKRHGAVIVKLRGTRFAFGRQIAEQVEVTEAEG